MFLRTQAHTSEFPYTGPYQLEPGINCRKFAFVGSRVTVNPPPTDTDLDVLVLCMDGVAYHEHLMHDLRAEHGGKDYGDGNDDMESYKVTGPKGVVYNYLTTHNADYFRDFVVATELARRFNITDKALRKEVFDLLCDGERWPADVREIQPLDVYHFNDPIPF